MCFLAKKRFDESSRNATPIKISAKKSVEDRIAEISIQGCSTSSNRLDFLKTLLVFETFADFFAAVVDVIKMIIVY